MMAVVVILVVFVVRGGINNFDVKVSLCKCDVMNVHEFSLSLQFNLSQKQAWQESI
jgi:hypothetical protein